MILEGSDYMPFDGVVVTRPLQLRDETPAEIRARGFKVELSDSDSNKVSYVYIIPPDENSPGSITFTVPDEVQFAIARKECQTHAEMLCKPISVKGDSITILGVDPVHASMITRGLEQQGVLAQGISEKFQEKLLDALHDWQQTYGSPEVKAHAKAETGKLQDFYRQDYQPNAPPRVTVSSMPDMPKESKLKSPMRPLTYQNEDQESKKSVSVPKESLKAFCAELEDEYNHAPKSAATAAQNPQVKKQMNFALQQAEKKLNEMGDAAQEQVAAQLRAQASVKSNQKLAEAIQSLGKSI